jgi:uncharacterized membrane protein YfcA
VITLIVLGALVGAVLGLTGAGGGIFAVPALVFGVGWTVTQATPVALMAVAGAAAVGAVEGLRKKLVRYKAAALMAVAGVVVTPLGLKAAHALPETALLTLFAVALLIVAYRMYRSSLLKAAETVASVGASKVPCRINSETGRLNWTPGAATALTVVGLLSGFLTGLLGVGGGFVIVPALKQVSDIGMHGIVATSLMVIALVAGGAVLVAFHHGLAIPPGVTIPFVVATAAGMVAGRLLISRIPARHLQRTFALLMVGVAISFFVKAAHGLAG